jgi:hypothetical protein
MGRSLAEGCAGVPATTSLGLEHSWYIAKVHAKPIETWVVDEPDLFGDETAALKDFRVRSEVRSAPIRLSLGSHRYRG